MRKIILLSLISAITFSTIDASAQDSTSTTFKRRKNTIRVNLTNPLIFGNSFIMGYERTIGKHASASLNVGTYSLPQFNRLRDAVNSADIRITGSTESFGLHTSLDYRFYLAKENKYYSPRGVYIGPYISYNMLDRTNKWILDTDNYQGEATTEIHLDILTAGFQLGYQFLFLKDRLALDLCLIGPGISNYKLSADFETKLEVGDQQELLDAINEALESRFPGYSIVIDDAEFRKSGTANTTTIGYRYVIHAGFRF